MLTSGGNYGKNASRPVSSTIRPSHLPSNTSRALNVYLAISSAKPSFLHPLTNRMTPPLRDQSNYWPVSACWCALNVKTTSGPFTFSILRIISFTHMHVPTIIPSTQETKYCKNSSKLLPTPCAILYGFGTVSGTFTAITTRCTLHLLPSTTLLSFWKRYLSAEANRLPGSTRLQSYGRLTTFSLTFMP